LTDENSQTKFVGQNLKIPALTRTELWGNPKFKITQTLPRPAIQYRGVPSAVNGIATTPSVFPTIRRAGAIVGLCGYVVPSNESLAS
jgi:hypothetical protein